MNEYVLTNPKQLNTEQKSHTLFWLMLCVFMALIFARGVAGISFPAVILLGFFAIMAFMGDRNEIITLCMVCIPAASAFQYKYGLFVCMVAYIIKYKDDIKFSLCVIPVVLMMTWELVHGLFYDFSVSLFLHDFPELILIAFFMCVTNKKVDYEFICRVLGFATVIIGFCVLCNVLKNNNYNLNALFEEGKYRFGKGNEDATQFGLNYNPNVLGSLCNIAIIALLQIRYMNKQKIIDYAMIVFLVLIGGLTISRSFILMCATIFVIFAMIGNKAGSGRIKTVLIVAILFSIIFFVVVNFLPGVYESFVGRFSVDDISNGRGELMDFYDEHIYSSWEYSLFGIGLQNMAGKMNQIYGLVTAVCHNGFQEIVVVWGYPGIAMFLSLIVCMIHSSKAFAKKHCFANFIPILFVLITAQSGQLITAGSKLLMLSFAYITLCTYFSKEEEKNE